MSTESKSKPKNLLSAIGEFVVKMTTGCVLSIESKIPGICMVLSNGQRIYPVDEDGVITPWTTSMKSPNSLYVANSPKSEHSKLIGARIIKMQTDPFSSMQNLYLETSDDKIYVFDAENFEIEPVPSKQTVKFTEEGVFVPFTSVRVEAEHNEHALGRLQVQWAKNFGIKLIPGGADYQRQREMVGDVVAKSGRIWIGDPEDVGLTEQDTEKGILLYTENDYRYDVSVREDRNGNIDRVLVERS